MYGRIFESAFTGSMMGAGAEMFAVWCYVLAHTKPDPKAPGGGSLELNPKLIAVILGMPVANVVTCIGKLCAGDPESRNKAFDGARLVHEGAFQYAVPSFDEYKQVASESEKREMTRQRVARHRQGRRGSDAATHPDAESTALGAQPDPALLPVGPVESVPRGTRRATNLIMSPLDYDKLKRTHAFVGERLRIPNVLHEQLRAQYGGDTDSADTALMAWYLELQAGLTADESIPDIFGWVRPRFAQWVLSRAKNVTVALPPVPGEVDDEARARALTARTSRRVQQAAQPS